MKVMAAVDLAAATSVEVVGRKAFNLGELIRAGFDVPPGVVLPANLHDADVQAAAGEALSRLDGERFAVRSSGVAEDLAAASFAGLYQTILGVTREEVAQATLACRASGRAQRVAAYRKKRGLDEVPSAVAVVIQQLVDPAAAGVAFSVNPVTGAHDVRVSAVKGLGERLVSGEAAADEWSIDQNGKAVCEAAPEGAIDERIAVRIAELARAVANHFGSPQDVEWALDWHDELFLLQARPITGVPDGVLWEMPDGSSYVRNYRLGEWFYEPLTPLFEDWLVNRLEGRLRELAHYYFGFPLRGRNHALINGWYFADIGFMPTSLTAMMSMLIRHLVPRAIAHPSRLLLMVPPMSTPPVRAHHQVFQRRVHPVHRRLVDESRKHVEVADASELTAIVDHLADDAGEYFFYIVVDGGYAWKSELKLAKFCQAHLAGSGLTSHQELLLNSREQLAGAPKVVSLDWYRPLAAPAPFESRDEARARSSRLLARRSDAESAARAALSKSPKVLRRFEALLSVAREFAAVREEQVAEFTAAWPVFRLALGRLAEDLVRRKVLVDADLIYFLTRDEVITATRELTAAALARRETWTRQRRLNPPLKLGPDHPLFRRMMEDEVDRFRAAGRNGGDELLRGMPCSPGIARGRVRVVAGPEGFDRFEAGEVLVAHTTTPGWTPLFVRAAAVVTDIGSVMADATRKLQDGMLVTVDGAAGVVLVG